MKKKVKKEALKILLNVFAILTFTIVPPFILSFTIYNNIYTVLQEQGIANQFLSYSFFISLLAAVLMYFYTTIMELKEIDEIEKEYRRAINRMKKTAEIQVDELTKRNRRNKKEVKK